MTSAQRPDTIMATLTLINAELPADVGASLEAYISQLEAMQASNEHSPTSESDNPPRWSHQRVREREAHHRERALKKLSNYR
jgi:hypothetical protein